MSKSTLIFFASSRGHKLRGALERTNCQLKYYSGESGNTLHNGFALLNALYAIIVSKRPMLVLTDISGAYSLLLLLASQFVRCPFVFRLRGDVWQERMQELQGLHRLRLRISIWIANSLVDKCSLLLPVCNYLGERSIEERTIEPTKIISIPTFVDIEQYVPAAVNGEPHPESKKLHPTDKIILSVTNFRFKEKVEALHAYASAFDAICEEHEHIVQWVIAGSGPHLEKFRHLLLASVKYPENITFLGKTSNVREWYQQCDFLLHLSYLDGLPNVILEASASAKPSLANAAFGIPETIVHDKTGYLVPKITHEELLHYSRQLLGDHELQSQFGKAARAYMISCYSVEAVAQQFQSKVLDRLFTN